MKRHAQVVVIGGGCMGASIAYHLAKRGINDVVLLEKKNLASGTTGKSTAVIRLHYTNETVVRMALESHRVFQNFKSEIGGDAGFKQTGWILCVGPEDEKSLRDNVAALNSLGVNTRILDGKEIGEVAPQMFKEDLAAAAYEPESGYADPSATTLAFAEAAQKLGVEIHQTTEAVGITVSGGKVKSVTTNNGEVETEAVVNAANVWGNRVASLVGLQLPLQATRTFMCLFGHPPTFGPMRLVVVDQVNKSYLRPEVGEQTWVGEVETVVRLVDNPDKFKEGVDFQERLELGGRFTRRFPVMEDADIRQGYASLYDITPDWHPILDKAPHVDGFYIAVGFSGHGFKLSPAVGRIMAELIDGQNPPEARFFRLSRFEEGKLIQARYGRSWMG